MRLHTVFEKYFYIAIALLAVVVCSCSNSESDIAYFAGQLEFAGDSVKKDLPIDDSEYPYAGIPRMVIETINHREIKDRETDVPAQMQIWGEFAPMGKKMQMTIRGRGNTSWTRMPKKGYKIEFVDKQSLFGMPKDRDWALISNYADKTLMSNYLMYHLSSSLHAYYAPRCEFIELYLNGEYLGVYLLTETIKIARNRVGIPKNENSYLVEFDAKYRNYEQVFFSKEIATDSIGKPFRVHEPKNATKEVLSSVEQYVKEFEIFLRAIVAGKDNHLEKWIDVDEYIKHYWVQEFSKNPDARYYSSVYFSWIKGGLIRMGPVWDFDLSFGIHNNEKNRLPENWQLQGSYWDAYLFKDSNIQQARSAFWNDNRALFVAVLNTIDSVQGVLELAAQNNFRRWNILESTDFVYHRFAYRTYGDAVEGLKQWIEDRVRWLDDSLLK